MDRAALITFLAHQPWLAQLDDFDRQALAAALQLRPVAGGVELITQGAKAQHVYLLIEGAVRVELVRGEAREVVRRLAPGALFGILSLLDNRPRSAACVAEGDVVIGVLERSAFQMLSHQHSRIAYPFQRALGAQLAEDFRWAVRSIEHRLVRVA